MYGFSSEYMLPLRYMRNCLLKLMLMRFPKRIKFLNCRLI